MGYRVLQNVVMTPFIEKQAKDLSDSLPFDIVITSGLRTAEAQAKAMFTKIELGDDLIALYADDSFAQGVIDAYPDLEAATEFVQSYADLDKGSKHLRGLAMDIRTRDLSESNLALLIETVEFFGWRPLLETIPPHLDVAFPIDQKIKFDKEVQKKTVIPLLLLIGGALLISRS